MPYCPECGYEYVTDIKECPDCHRELLDKPAQTSASEPELVELHPLPGIIYAEMVKEALKHAGITCLIKPAPLESGFLARGDSAAGGNCRIFVEKKHQKRAAKILDDMVDHI